MNVDDISLISQIMCIRTVLGFRSFDASNITPIRINNKMAGGQICPRFNDEMTKVQSPTYQRHFKFAIDVKQIGTDESERDMYALAMMCLVYIYGVPKEMFENKGTRVKLGCVCFNDNPYSTNVRVWTTKKVGKKLIYEITVSGYKDAEWVDTNQEKLIV